MQKISENEINWINDGDDQDALTLNRPVKELLQKLGNQATSNILQETGDNPDQMISQKALTELLTGWGSLDAPPPSSTDEMINGIYFLSSSMVQEFGIGGGGDGQLLVLGKQTDVPGSQSGEVQQIAFVNGKIYFRYSDRADEDGKPIWSEFDNIVLQKDIPQLTQGKIDSSKVVQTTGNSTTNIMSQKQVSDLFTGTFIKSTEGYYKFPSGLILQWGTNSRIGNYKKYKNFPIKFPNQVLACLVSSITDRKHEGTIVGYFDNTTRWWQSYRYTGDDKGSLGTENQQMIQIGY